MAHSKTMLEDYRQVELIWDLCPKVFNCAVEVKREINHMKISWVTYGEGDNKNLSNNVAFNELWGILEYYEMKLKKSLNFEGFKVRV